MQDDMTNKKEGWETRHADAELLKELAQDNVFQPATALWRFYEVRAILTTQRLAGLGIDIGCGDGSLLTTIFRRMPDKCSFVGVEPNPNDASKARKRGLYSHVHVTTADAIQEETGTFDFAFANSVLEHIPNVEPVLSEISRLLKRGGALVATVPSPGFLRCLKCRGWYAWLCRTRKEDYRCAIDRRLQHYHYMTADEWRSVLQKHEMELTEVHSYLTRSAVQMWEWLSNNTGGLLYELAGRKLPTRTLQEKSGMSAVDQSRVKNGLAIITEWVLKRCINRIERLDQRLNQASESGCFLLRAIKK